MGPSHLCFKSTSGDTGAHKELFENRYLKAQVPKGTVFLYLIYTNGGLEASVHGRAV